MSLPNAQPAQRVRCAHCGKNNAPGLRFCGYCGNALPVLASDPNDPADVPSHLTLLAGRGLVREFARQPELEYIFKHVLLQEAVYHTQLHKQRKETHQLVGHALEQLYADRLDEFAPRLAQHFFQSEDWALAARYSERAAQHAFKRYALREAIMQYEQSLAALDKLPAAPPDLIVDTMLGWAQAAFKFVPYEQVLEGLSRAEQLARGLADKHRLVKVLYWMGNVFLAKGLFSRAYAVIKECYELASALGDEELSVMPLYFLGYYMIDTQPAAALSHLEHTLALAQKHDNLEMQVYTYGTRAMVRARLGQFDLARADLQVGFDLSRQLRSPTADADMDLFAAFASMDMGEVQQGLAFAQRSVEKALHTDQMECICWGYYCLGMAHLQNQQLPHAQSAFEEAVRRSRHSGAMHIENIGRAGIAMTHLFNGRADAIAELERTLASARALNDAYGTSFVSQTLAEIYLTRGELESAERYLLSALDYYKGNNMRPYLARSLQALAQLREKQGRSDEAMQARADSDALLSANLP